MPQFDEKPNGATKHDNAKPALEFIPKVAMFAMGDAFAYGAKKYGAWNYTKGMAVTRCCAAAVRHIYQFLAGETLDPESGKPHLGHALASLAMACQMMELGNDDRPTTQSNNQGGAVCE